MYTLIDLFSGAGGLSLGFTQTGKFVIVTAAENNPYARKTYKENHAVNEMASDVREINYLQIKERYGNIDVLIGGPPCQGFSNANRQKTMAISSNNNLVKEYIRAVIELRPKVFVMENVKMIRSDVHRFYCNELEYEKLQNLNIRLKCDEIILLNKDLSNRLSLNADSNLDEYEINRWQEPYYNLINILFHVRGNTKKLQNAIFRHQTKLKEFCDCIIENNHTDFYIRNLEQDLKHAIMFALDEHSIDCKLSEMVENTILIQRMLRLYKELKDNNIIIRGIDYTNGVHAQVISCSVIEYIHAVLKAEPFNYNIKQGLFNAAEFGAPQKRVRNFIIGSALGEPIMPVGILDQEHFKTVRDAIGDIEEIVPDVEISSPPKFYKGIKDLKNTDCGLEFLRNSELLHNHIVTATGPLALERFKSLKPGENFHDLDRDLKSTYTNAQRTQNTIYKRLMYDKPSDTVLNIRKSMWIHPTKDRALSIREAARLQTFPDSFRFCGTKDSQYQQVGNAVPPILAKAVAESVVKTLESRRKDNG